MEIKESQKRQIMITAILFVGSVSFVSMLYSLRDTRFFTVSLALLIFALTAFMIDVLYLLSESKK
jgi:hypothetical protein